jgi:hypothetical protein
MDADALVSSRFSAGWAASADVEGFERLLSGVRVLNAIDPIQTRFRTAQSQMSSLTSWIAYCIFASEAIYVTVGATAQRPTRLGVRGHCWTELFADRL